MYSAECPPTKRIYGVDYRQLVELSREPVAAADDDIQIPSAVVERIDAAGAPLMGGFASDTADSVRSSPSTASAPAATASAPAAATAAAAGAATAPAAAPSSLHHRSGEALLLRQRLSSPPSAPSALLPPPSREPAPVATCTAGAAPAPRSAFVPYATRTGRKFSIMRLDPRKIPTLCGYCSALQSHCICPILPHAPDYQPDETEQDQWYPGKLSANDDQK